MVMGGFIEKSGMIPIGKAFMDLMILKNKNRLGRHGPERRCHQRFLMGGKSPK
jgi:hypothetical protein